MSMGIPFVSQISSIRRSSFLGREYMVSNNKKSIFDNKGADKHKQTKSNQVAPVVDPVRNSHQKKSMMEESQFMEKGIFIHSIIKTSKFVGNPYSSRSKNITNQKSTFDNKM